MRRLRSPWHVAFLAFALAVTSACVSTKFTPHKTAYRSLDRLTEKALLAQPGDMEDLKAAGGYVSVR